MKKRRNDINITRLCCGKHLLQQQTNNQAIYHETRKTASYADKGAKKKFFVIAWTLFVSWAINDGTYTCNETHNFDIEWGFIVRSERRSTSNELLLKAQIYKIIKLVFNFDLMWTSINHFYLSRMHLLEYSHKFVRWRFMCAHF